MVLGQSRFGMDAERGFEQGAGMLIAVDRVDDIDDDRDAGEAAYRIGGRHDLVAHSGAALFVAIRLGAQHQVRKIDVPFVRRNVRTFGQVTEVAKVAMVHDLPVILLVDAVDLHGLGFVDQVEQGRKSIAQAHAAAAAMADIENAFEFPEKRLLIVKTGVVLSQGMASRRFQAAFSRCGRHRGCLKKYPGPENGPG